MMPNSSAVTAKMKSVWLSGRMRFTVPSPGPLPEPAALHEALDGGVDLEGVAGLRVEEAVDARGDVRQQRVGGEQPEHAEAAEAQHPEQVQAGQEDEPAPDHA